MRDFYSDCYFLNSFCCREILILFTATANVCCGTILSMYRHRYRYPCTLSFYVQLFRHCTLHYVRRWLYVNYRLLFLILYVILCLYTYQKYLICSHFKLNLVDIYILLCSQVKLPLDHRISIHPSILPSFLAFIHL